MTVAAPAPESPGSRPFWIPPGVKFEQLPRNLQVALKEILQPAYQELVLEAPSSLEKNAGLSLVHSLWLELIDQHELGKAMAPMLADGQSMQQNEAGVQRHLRLVSAKEKYLRLLMQVRTHVNRLGRDEL